MKVYSRRNRPPKMSGSKGNLGKDAAADKPNDATTTLAATMAQMAQFMKEMREAQVAQTAQAAQAIALQTQATSENHNGQNKMGLFARKNEEFGKLGGTVFTGTGGPIVAHNWLKNCKAIFAEMQIEDSLKQKLAAHRLDDRARFWWQATFKGLGRTEVSWKKFKKLFKKEYIPFDAKARLIDEFMSLKQGSMTVYEYRDKFNELSRYAPYMVDTPYKLNKKFQDGLIPALGHRLIPSIHAPFNEFVGFAAQYEASMNEMYARKKAQKNKWNSGRNEASSSQGSSQRNKKGRYSKGKQNQRYDQKSDITPGQLPAKPVVPQLTAPTGNRQGNADKKTCYNCGLPGHLSNTCTAPKKSGSMTGYGCGKVGHMRKNCPENRGQAYAIMPSEQNVQARGSALGRTTN